jgi:hypothetical protein
MFHSAMPPKPNAIKSSNEKPKPIFVPSFIFFIHILLTGTFILNTRHHKFLELNAI